MSVSERTKRLIWTRAGGRCTLCKALAVDDSSGVAVPFAEVAHNMGQGSGPKTPRRNKGARFLGTDDEANLLLLCLGCHQTADTLKLEKTYSREILRDVKHRHENEVQRLLNGLTSPETLVLRVVGELRASHGDATRGQVVRALVAAGHKPEFLPNIHRDEIELKLVDLHENVDSFWAVQARRMDEVVGAVHAHLTDRAGPRHVSIFGLAPVPLLIRLGWCLDDTYAVTAYPRPRSSERWGFDEAAPPRAFDVALNEHAGTRPNEATLVINASGTVDRTALPAAAKDVVTAVITTSGCTPAANIGDGQQAAASFRCALREALGALEAAVGTVDRLHIIAAVPVAFAVEIGRAIDRAHFPTVQTYHFNGGYSPALTLTTKEPT